MNIDIESLERATLDAVAPPVVAQISDWLLPMDRSTIGRAISAVPLQHGNLNVQSIGEIEGMYKERGYTAQFRIPDLTTCSNIHAELKARSYCAVQPMLTMAAAILSAPLPARACEVIINTHPCEEWKSVYLSAGFDPIDGLNRVNALSRSRCVQYGYVLRNGRPVAAGTASMSQGWLGIHGMRTRTDYRGQGLASTIIEAFINLAADVGVSKVYLQVEESNAGAVKLYERLGFHTAWRYHYWKKTTQP